MLNKILKIFSEVVYVQVIENGYIVKVSGSENAVKFESTTPFSNSRLAVGNFVIAEHFLKGIIQKTKSNLLQPSPIVIMHQIIRNEDGLSQVESRVLRELAYGAGAIESYVWQGSPLTDEDIENEIYKNNT